MAAQKFTNFDKYFYFFKDFIYLFLEEKGGREGEKHQSVTASHAPPMGTWPTAQAGAPTGNQTGNPLVHRLALNPLSHTSQGLISFFKCILI